MPFCPTDQLRQAVMAAAVRPPVWKAVRELYAQLQRNIETRAPRCLASGRCCRFEEFGHRLYVTTMELATFAYELQSAPPGAAARLADWTRGDRKLCPFQIDRLCSVHRIRPFGCRVFFCDPTATQWQEQQYELFHQQLKRLHDQLGIEYYYVEWREGLAVLGREQLTTDH